MDSITYKAVWRPRHQTEGPGGNDLAWILESIDMKGERKTFLARINREYLQFPGTKSPFLEGSMKYARSSFVTLSNILDQK